MKKVLVSIIMISAFMISAEAKTTTRTTTNVISIKAAPPAAVLSSFVALFGNVAVRQWKLRSDGNWRAHFMNNGIPWEATFRPDGTLVKSERDRKG
jgi:hypothetical protein